MTKKFIFYFLSIWRSAALNLQEKPECVKRLNPNQKRAQFSLWVILPFLKRHGLKA